MSDKPIQYTVSAPANISNSMDTVDPRTRSCVMAYIDAYKTAQSMGVPEDGGQCTLVAKLAFETQLNIVMMDLRPLVHPKGLVS